MGISKYTYRQIKLAYRQGGMIRSMPMHDGAQEFIRGLREGGMAVWICTTRPYLRLDNMAVDTTHWLKRHGLKADGLIASDLKYHDLSKAVGSENVVAMIDDLPEMCVQATRAKIKPLMISRSHNLGSNWNGRRVESLWEAAEVFTNLKLGETW
jgi:hypothetical protein